ncbi:MAG: ATP-binding cassette domain-containing protein [Planctomycetes bacterium]|nr:ATP-binding cassette domain-containing protein [Planctomycetota bacterium]
MRFRLIVPGGETRELACETSLVRFGGDADCEIRFDAAAFPRLAGIVASLQVNSSETVLVSNNSQAQVFLNKRPLSETLPVAVGDRIRFGVEGEGPIVEILELTADPTPRVSEMKTPRTESEKTYQADSADVALLRGSAVAAERFVVQGISMIGRQSDLVHVHLDHPHVSRLHARLTAMANQVTLEDLGSANGTYVNGRRIVQTVSLKPKDRIDIGPYSLVFKDGALVSRSRANNIELTARNVNQIVKDRGTGQPLALLQNIDLVVRPREFVCLLGPSGSGKTTLLNVLSGRQMPSDGAVEINGADLYAQFASLKQQIAVVPQKDLLHETLSVGSALRYTAELRLPPDTGRDEIDSAVTDILDVVGLTERRETLIRHLSGGQIKRASLANELMARPSLLFLDEVTSGLDEQTDREVMQLFRRVADGGKTVVCITHNLANIEATAHLVVILTEGGRLAFVGTPDEAKTYFRINRLGDVYQRLAERTPPEWQTAFQKTPEYEKYVEQRLPLKRDSDSSTVTLSVSDLPKTKAIGQSQVLIRRNLAIWRGDRPALFALVGQSLLVALLLGLVFGDVGALENPLVRVQRTINLLFLLNVSSFWLGCNTAAKELVKERIIFARERGFNLRVDSYLASKLAVLLVIGAIQVTLLFAIVRFWCGPPGSVLLQYVVLLALMVAGTVLGLCFSAVAKTEEMASALVPIAVIPQIILAGVIAPLSGVSEFIARAAITCYHGQQGLEAILPEADRNLHNLPEASIIKALVIVALHAGFFAMIAFVMLHKRTRPRKLG